MRTIETTNGYTTQVDDRWYDELAQYRWYGLKVGSRVSVTRYEWDGQRGRRVTIYMHRIVANAQPGQIVDHIDRNPLNNQEANLRICTNAQNCANRPRQRNNGTSRYKGVSWHRQRRRWQAQIQVLGRQMHLGDYLSERDAASAYNDAAHLHFGDFAYLNPI